MSLDAIEIEKSVLGSFLVDNNTLQHLDLLNESDFSVEGHKIIFKEIKNLCNNKMLDLVTLSEKIKDNDISMSYISNLTVLSSPYSIENHISILRGKARKRKIVNQSYKLIEAIRKDDDLEQLIYNFEVNAKKIVNNNSTVEDDVMNIATKFLDYIENKTDEKISFGVKFLDEMIGGLYKGELTTIAAKSGVGKTALALQILRSCLKQNKKVLLISREMSDVQMFVRNIVSLTGIDSKTIKNKVFTEEQLEQIIKAIGVLTDNNNLFINDNVDRISKIKTRIRQVKPDVVIIDYLQLLTVEKNEGSREREVATLSREIKNMTLDFKIPIIQLSQLNDEMKDSRPWGERPMRDSKAIYHDSNNVIYIHEPVGADLEDACEENGLNVESVKAAKERSCILVDLIVAKNRDGSKGIKQHWFAGDRLYFQEVMGGGLKEKYDKQQRYNRQFNNFRKS
ncbi:replicative DNA helicase [Terrisporobacter othiniensis]|uniref:replicative DNA helicase n=1 Tax=Terrisporobacter othiniensis TaxID=1577792 RepID=UPI0009DE11B3|nr:DnaB-like helicase C-terminal domain-containing protein [Terrisporobacter othiniensis]